MSTTTIAAINQPRQRRRFGGETSINSSSDSGIGLLMLELAYADHVDGVNGFASGALNSTNGSRYPGQILSTNNGFGKYESYQRQLVDASDPFYTIAFAGTNPTNGSW